MSIRLDPVEKRSVKPIGRLTYDRPGRMKDQPMTIVHRWVSIIIGYNLDQWIEPLEMFSLFIYSFVNREKRSDEDFRCLDRGRLSPVENKMGHFSFVFECICISNTDLHSVFVILDFQWIQFECLTLYSRLIEGTEGTRAI